MISVKMDCTQALAFSANGSARCSSDHKVALAISPFSVALVMVPPCSANPIPHISYLPGTVDRVSLWLPNVGMHSSFLFKHDFSLEKFGAALIDGHALAVLLIQFIFLLILGCNTCFYGDAGASKGGRSGRCRKQVPMEKLWALRSMRG